MKINVNQQMKNLDGTPCMSIVDGKDKILTLKEVCLRALLDPMKLDKDNTPTKALDRLEKAFLINKGGLVDLDIDALKDIKDMIFHYFPTLIYGRACKMLEGGKDG